MAIIIACERNYCLLVHNSNDVAAWAKNILSPVITLQPAFFCIEEEACKTQGIADILYVCYPISGKYTFSYLHFMSHTALPSVKGQITIPPAIRDKYHISKQTPIVIEDKGKGIIMLKIMSLVAADEIEYYENKKEFGVTFKHGIDPKTLIDAIEEIDG